ncbi:MAG: DNA polymerase I [Anaerolineae bacterium]|nr:DNA polymerase I [Anaerolineae bacterium]
MAEPAKLVLIDGHALIYRAYFALPQDMSTSRGELTNAVYGFASMLLNVLRDERPDYLAVTLDRGRTFRHDAYAEYKANRARMPDGLRAQLERIDELLQAFAIPTYSAETFEADDVLAALAEQAQAQGAEVLIVTGDTDTFQLIGPQVRVLTSRRQFGDTVTYDEAGIRERYGLEPAQLIDYKALTGDKSDNVPGVAGIGEKTAAALLQKYGSLEGIYDHLTEVTPARFRQALEAGREMAFKSKYLVTIVSDAPVTLDMAASRVKGAEVDRERVTRLFRELEFRSLLPRLPWAAGQGPEGAPGTGAGSGGRLPAGEGAAQLSLFGEPSSSAGGDLGPAFQGDGYQIVDSLAALDAAIAKLAAAGREGAVAVDVESTSVDPMAAGLVGIALTTSEGKGYYIPVGHQPAESNLPLEVVAARLRPLLGSPEVLKAAHNANYDLTALAEHGLEVSPPLFDTMIAAWLLDPASRGLGLKDLAADRLEIKMTPIEALIGAGKKQITMDAVAVDKAALYACADVDMTLRLANLLRPELHDKALWELFAELEMPLVPVIVDMQRAGVKLDVDYLAEMSRNMGRRLGELQEQIEQQVGHPLNINSTQQLSVTLFNELGLALPWMRKGKSGYYSTAADVLEKLRGSHVVVDLILEHRQLTKLKGTYIDALPALINPRTGRLHTSYNQAGTTTGRVSSSNPNLQNIPIRTDVGREIRRAFMAEKGCLLLAADYSQVELRILAHISGDPAMLAAFARGEDIHASTAAAIYHVPLDQVTPAQRRVAKMTNFAISYGVTGYGLAERTGLTQEEGDAFIQTYFQTYPRIKDYLEKTRRLAQQEGYVETLLGRRRYFPEMSPDAGAPATVYQAAYRAAINAPIQGTAADILKVAMNRLWRALRARRLRSRMILQVHDELVLEAPEEELDEVIPLVVDTMEGAYQLDAPLKVDVKVGRDWLDQSPIKIAKGNRGTDDQR